MSEEHTEATEETPSETPAETTAEENTEDAATKFVEMDPQTEARFKRIYANMKQYERVTKEMGEQNRALLDKVNGLEQGKVDETLRALRAQKQEALDNMDSARVAEIDEAMVDLKLAVKEEPAQAPQEQANDMGLTPQQEARLVSWATETNGDGEQIRPWAMPGHPYYGKLTNVAAAAMQDPNLAHYAAEGNMEPILKEVDKLMGLDQSKPGKRAAPTALSGKSDAQPPRPKGNGKLSADQKIIADAMGLSHEEYAKGITDA